LVRVGVARSRIHIAANGASAIATAARQNTTHLRGDRCWSSRAGIETAAGLVTTAAGRDARGGETGTSWGQSDSEWKAASASVGSRRPTPAAPSRLTSCGRTARSPWGAPWRNILAPSLRGLCQGGRRAT
jgi:hypothetical protein